MTATTVSPTVLKALAQYDTPTVCNVIELFNLRPRSAGYMDQTIALKIPAIWMQEDVIHEAAAAKARKAGIFVTMDRCILKEHRARFL